MPAASSTALLTAFFESAEPSVGTRMRWYMRNSSLDAWTLLCGRTGPLDPGQARPRPSTLALPHASCNPSVLAGARRRARSPGGARRAAGVGSLQPAGRRQHGTLGVLAGDH